MTIQQPAQPAADLAMFGGGRAVPRALRIRPWPMVTDQDEQTVHRVLKSGRFTSASSGEQEIAGLEREWAQYVGTEHCVAVSDGTAALTVALSAAGVQPGDEVVVPALSFIGSAAAPLRLLAVPVFVDIDPVTFTLDPAALEAAITGRTKAIVVVHLHGLPADLDRITEIAARHEVTVIEDAAQAHGAQYRGRSVGSIGAVNTFSLNVSTNFATCGESGLITTDDTDVATRATMLRQSGQLVPAGGERSYTAQLPGWNCQPNAIQAGFTRSRLAQLPADMAAREENVGRLLGQLAAYPGFLVPEVPQDRTHAWHILRIRVNPAAFGLADEFAGPLRSVVQRALRAEGVPAVPYQLQPLPAQRFFTGRRVLGAHPWAAPGVVDRPYRPEDFPATLRVLDDSFTIQKAHLHPDSGPLLDRYADAFEKVWHHRAALAAIAATRDYTPHWERAAEIADTEWAGAVHTR